MRLAHHYVHSLILGVLALLVLTTPASAQDLAKTEYVCPMYCTDEISHSPARCTVCRMDLVERARVENPVDHKVMFSQNAHQLIRSDSNVVLLDVQTENEFRNDGRLKGSILIPVRKLESRMIELEGYKGQTIIVYCSHGIRSARAATILSREGHSAYSLLGGLIKWKREKLPIQRSQ